MNLLDKHEDGCLPMSKPCQVCKLIAFLRKNLQGNKFKELCDLLGMSDPTVAQLSEAELQDLADKDIRTAFKGTPNRILNRLTNDNITTVRQLVAKTEHEFRRTPSLGVKSRNELKQRMSELGLSFGMELPPAKE